MPKPNANRLVLVQFIAVALPLAVVLFTQMFADTRRAAAIEHSRPLRIHAQEARAGYKSFLAGVSDAVDTGSLSAPSAEALRAAVTQMQALAAAGADPEVLQGAVPALQALSAQLAAGADLAALMKARDAVRAADVLTKGIADEFDRRDEAVMQEASRSAHRQQYIVLVAVLLSSAITFVFVVASQRRLRAREAADRRLLEESLRLQAAINNVSGNVVVVDRDRRIVYLNPAAIHMFTAAASDIRSDLPNFDPATLVGTSLDVFHKDPVEQQRLFADLSSTLTAAVTVGGRTFRTVANPVVDAAGARLGTVVEWLDRTQEIAVEDEVSAIVAAVARGDLSNRLHKEGKSGFLAQLASGLDGIVENMATIVQDVNAVIAAGKAGDLTPRITVTGKSGAFGELSNGVNTLMDNMMSLVDEIKAAAGAVRAGADEIAAGTLNLSQRTEEQASSLEETAAAMDRMTSTVKQSADNAAAANTLAAAARERAEQGGTVVNAAVQAMGGINASSTKIVDIIGVIDEIAFQTNLLALNAAVEAARAGEQGRGFAVVASEVRTLAVRSAAAAKEIKTLIKDSVAKVEEGSKLVDQSGRALGEIATAVAKVTDVIGAMAASGQEQASGIEQVNRAVTQMDGATQQNAALVEEAAAASQTIAERARLLSDLVAHYRVSARPDAVSDLPARAPHPPLTAAAAARGSRVRAPSAAAAGRRRLANAGATAAGDQPSDWDEF